MLAKLYGALTILLILLGVVVVGYVYWNRGSLFQNKLLQNNSSSLYENLVPTRVKVSDRWISYADTLRDKALYTVENANIILFAASLNSPTKIEVVGDYVVISETNSGNIIVLKDTNGDKSADEKKIFASGLDAPYGVSYYNEDLYVATKNAILKYPDFINQLNSSTNTHQVLVSDLPFIGLNKYKSLLVGPDNKILVHFGSSCNDCIEQDKRRGSIVSYNLDGKDEKIYATGLKNVYDITFYRGDIFALEDNIDLVGEGTLEEINRILPAHSYGWPEIYNESTRNLKHTETSLINYTTPVVTFNQDSDSRGISMVYSKFGVGVGALVTFSGDSGFDLNAKKVGLVNFENGEVKDVLSFWQNAETYIGTPYDITGYKEGLLISDLDNGFVYYFEP